MKLPFTEYLQCKGFPCNNLFDPMGTLSIPILQMGKLSHRSLQSLSVVVQVVTPRSETSLPSLQNGGRPRQAGFKYAELSLEAKLAGI